MMRLDYRETVWTRYATVRRISVDMHHETVEVEHQSILRYVELDVRLKC